MRAGLDAEFSRVMRPWFAAGRATQVDETTLDKMCEIVGIEGRAGQGVRYDIQHVAQAYGFKRAQASADRSHRDTREELLQASAYLKSAFRILNGLNSAGALALLREFSNVSGVARPDGGILPLPRVAEAASAAAQSLDVQKGRPRTAALDLAATQLTEIFFKATGQQPLYQRVKTYDYREDLMTGSSRFFGLFFEAVDPKLGPTTIGKAINRARDWVAECMAEGIPDSFNCRQGRKLHEDPGVCAAIP